MFGLVPFLLPLLAPTQAAPTRSFTPLELGRYYGEQSQGAIQLAPPTAEVFGGGSGPLLARALPGLRFSKRHGAVPYRLYPTIDVTPGAVQALFGVDLDRFLAVHGAPDLAGAKLAAYSKLDFEAERQAHRPPYLLLSDWGQLLHPPIRRVDGIPFERISRDFFPAAPVPGAGEAFFDPAFQERLDRESGTGLSFGNRLRLLPDGTSYPEKLALVRSARRRLSVSVMTLVCDKSTLPLIEAMIERHRKGVDVRLILERLYRESISHFCVDRLLAAGVPVITPPGSLYSKAANGVMHQKVWIADDERAIIGGENVLDYENEADGFNHMNHDSDLAIDSGPLVRDASLEFHKSWLRYDRKDRFKVRAVTERIVQALEARIQGEEVLGLRGSRHYAAVLSDPARRMDGVCRVALQGPGAKRQPIGPWLLAYMEASRSSIMFTTPDITYDPDAPGNHHPENSWATKIMRLLKKNQGPEGPRILAISNGVGGGAGELSIWLKHREEEAQRKKLGLAGILANQVLEIASRRAALGNRDRMQMLMRSNPAVSAWTYFQYVHAKHFYFDRTAAFVGSWNLDHYSADLSSEAGVLCLDTSLRDQVEKQFALDLANSIPVVSRNGK